MGLSVGISRRSGIVSILAGLALAGVALADVSDIVFQVQASNDAGSGVFTVYFSDGTWEGQRFYWELPSSVPIMSATGQEVAWLIVDEQANRRNVVELFGDPQVNLGFAMQAGPGPTNFTVKSALLTIVPALLNPDGRASVGINVSDADGTGATLTGLGPTGGAYLAQYNGFVPAGTTFDESIPGIVAPPFSTNSGSNDTGWLPIAGLVSDMSTQVSFQLTAFDFASGTSNFQIVPEPAGALLALAAVGLLRRR